MEHRIYCGAEASSGDVYPPWQALSAPLSPHTTLPPNPTSASRKRKRSNGCGTEIHYRALVAPTTKMWRAAETCESNLIVPLDADYFDKEGRRRLQLGMSACGCVRIGMGCAICGNPLGSLTVPCPAHDTSKLHYYAFLPSAVSPPLPTFSPEHVPPPVPPPPISVYSAPPRYRTPRHPTSPPPPPRLFAWFTPTPSPEQLPVELPSDPAALDPADSLQPLRTLEELNRLYGMPPAATSDDFHAALLGASTGTGVVYNAPTTNPPWARFATSEFDTEVEEEEEGTTGNQPGRDG